MKQVGSLVFAVFGMVLAAGGAQAAQSAPQRMGYTKDQATMAGLASYIGLSTFCGQYNYGFPQVAARLQQKMNNQPFWTEATPDRKSNLNQIFDISRKLGENGYLYVKSEDAFLNTPKPGMSMQFVCMRAHEGAQDLAKVLN